MSMFRKIAFVLIAATVTVGSTAPVTAQDWDPYTQCMIDHCFGNFQNDPVGYEACRVWCWRNSGGGNRAQMVAKLD
jgi:hypothetical protein